MYNERLRYLKLTGTSHTGKRKAIEIIIKETKSLLSVEEMAEICFTPSKEAQRFHINKKRLICDRCNTNKHLVAVPIVLDYKYDLTDNVEYYCGNTRTNSLLFSKCWNHVQGYENRKGENRLTLIQDTA